ncbi:Golgi integral membrane protein 4 [Triplophysa tibetana]|uniref:Golgi integral membrane protein 4 n=1 Tax=Triplophysa tibetana TaxID=1572043 RepID=A0A5A9PE78_9TELE|nr:Golgi integral membrane protein 4 [Triplophysa tibetana]
MGKGICTRRQRRFFQSFLLLLFICGTVCALMISYEMHRELKKTEATALQYQQHQESLSAQLQVVYEHHSKLEKSLQKERLEHKKSEEDFLVFKRESQKALNKEKIIIIISLGNVFFCLCLGQSQHEDLKMQYYELQKKNQNQGENHERILDEHRQELDHLQREKVDEISRLKENAYNLQVENKQLRKAHQDIYTQLLDVREQHINLRASKDHLTLTLEDHKNALVAAQLQVDELRRLKENLNKASSAGQAEKKHKFATEPDHSPILKTVENRHSPYEELDKKPNQAAPHFGHTDVSPLQVEGFEEKGKGFYPQVSEIENYNETKVAVKQPHQIDVFAEGRGKKEEKSTSKEREGEDESKKAALEHSLSNPEELGINHHNTLSQTLEKQIQMEPLHTTEGHFRPSDPIITGNAVIAHHVIAGQDDAKEYTQHHDMDSYVQNFEMNMNMNLNGVEFKEAKDTPYKSNVSKDRPEEDEQLVVAGSPEQEDKPDEQYDDEVREHTH